MTPPSFQIGQEVEIIGVRCDGEKEYMGDRFVISQYHFDQNGERCSAIGFPWYPASSLRLVEEPVFNIGDKVRITNGADDHYEATFVVDIKLSDRNKYSCKKPFSDGQSVPYYSGRFLEKVEEELKIGDWVEVIGPSRFGFTTQIGKIFRIDEIDGPYFSAKNVHWYPRDALKKMPKEVDLHLDIKDGLRKLPPEEVVFHTGTIGYKIQECASEMEKAKDAMREILAPLVDERLAAIEKRLDAQKDAIIEMDLRLDVDAEAIKVLEGERPEICDCPNGHQIPNGEPIHIVIVKGDKMHTWCDTCPVECLTWCEKVLDSMREG